MDLNKHKGILALREELNSLESVFKEEQKNVVNTESDKLLTDAVKKFISYVEEQGFIVSGKEDSEVNADLDGITIRLKRYPLIISIDMPNYEKYSVSVVTTLEYSSHKQTRLVSQDIEIEQLKNSIEDVKEKISAINDQTFKYELYIEPRNGLYDNSSRKSFIKFEDAINVMFS